MREDEPWEPPVIAQGDVMQRQLDAIAHRAGPDARAVWLVPVGTADAIGFEVPVAPVLRSALRHFVSPAADLMLATPTAADGLCVERNHAADGDEYEIVAWGRFA